MDIKNTFRALTGSIYLASRKTVIGLIRIIPVAAAIMGMAPFGSLLAGSLTSRIGVSNTLILSGICCIIGAFVFAGQMPSIRALIKPIYVRKGILPANY